MHRKPINDGYYSPKNQSHFLNSKYFPRSPQLSDDENLSGLSQKRYRKFEYQNSKEKIGKFKDHLRQHHEDKRRWQAPNANSHKRYVDFLSQIGAGNNRQFTIDPMQEYDANEVNNSYNSPKSWKSFLREDILQEYQDISQHNKSDIIEITEKNKRKDQNGMHQKQTEKTLNRTTNIQNKKSKKRQVSSIQQEELSVVDKEKLEEMKMKYEDRIKTLEHQNSNLKEQLHYLRAAILANFQQSGIEEKMAEISAEH